MNIDIILLENLEMMSLDPQITLFSFSTCKRAEHALVILKQWNDISDSHFTRFVHLAKEKYIEGGHVGKTREANALDQVRQHLTLDWCITLDIVYVSVSDDTKGLLWWLRGKEPVCQCRRHEMWV